MQFVSAKPLGTIPAPLLVALVIFAAVTVGCSRPTTPDVRLSNDVNLSATPGLIEPLLLSGPPWLWQAGWAVNLTAPEEVARGGDVFVAQRTRIEQPDGRVSVELTEQARWLEPHVGMRSVVQFPQGVTYEVEAAPPVAARLVMTARLFDGHGRSEAISTTQTVAEYTCGTKHKPLRSASDPHGLPFAQRRGLDVGSRSTSPFLASGTCHYHDDDFLRRVRGEVIVLPIGADE